MNKRLGIIAIGRNEGPRLRRCLRSVVVKADRVVYVDSGSTDDSVAFAESLGVDVVELDQSVPFTMARARNTGFEHLMALDPSIELVQFVDGDCEVTPYWLGEARLALAFRPNVAVVCGRRRERSPRASVYNLLCDIEWHAKPGVTMACGGDAMMRVEAFSQVGGFNPTMIAGEEGELCYRLRQNGWRIVRLDEQMTLHDAAMTRFSQWWRRAVRSGHAYAHGAALHWREPGRYNVRPVLSILFWSLLVPAGAVAAGWWLRPVAAGAVALLYPLLVARVYRWCRQQHPPRDAATYAMFCVPAKFAQLLGVLAYLKNRLLRRRPRLIEYKSPADAFASAS